MTEKYKIEYSREVSKVIDMAREEGVDLQNMLYFSNYMQIKLTFIAMSGICEGCRHENDDPDCGGPDCKLKKLEEEDDN